MEQPSQGEPVFVVTDYWDGPREGVANFRGTPHLFECVFSKEDDEYTDVFRLLPVTQDDIALALEQNAIFRRWSAAFRAGRTDLSTQPALPEDRARHDELGARLSIDERGTPELVKLARGRFQSNGGVQPEYSVVWRSV